MLTRNPADNVAVELNHTEIYIVCQVQDKATFFHDKEASNIFNQSICLAKGKVRPFNKGAQKMRMREKQKQGELKKE